jgi:hypothetical protein
MKKKIKILTAKQARKLLKQGKKITFGGVGTARILNNL